MTRSHTSTVDRNLVAIYCIAAEGEVVRPSRLAHWLAVKAPAVSDALQCLERDDWVLIGPNRSITLTSDGDRVVATLVRRHRILERWLTVVLGFDWASADVGAERLSSVISGLVVAQIDTSMGSSSTCPQRQCHSGARRTPQRACGARGPRTGNSRHNPANPRSRQALDQGR